MKKELSSLPNSMFDACKVLNKCLLRWKEMHQELQKHILEQRSNKAVLLHNQYIIMLILENMDIVWQARMIVFFTGHWIRMEKNIGFALGGHLQSLASVFIVSKSNTLPLSLSLC